MVSCSNPLQCQLASRVECTCACQGKNHGILRKMIGNPETETEGKQKLEELQKHQAELKKVKRVERRKKRAEARKSQKEEYKEVLNE